MKKKNKWQKLKDLLHSELKLNQKQLTRALNRQDYFDAQECKQYENLCNFYISKMEELENE